MAREGHGADGKSVYAKKIGTGSVMPVAAKKMGLKGSATRKSNVDTTLTKLPATVKEAHRLDSRERGRLNTMLRNAFFAEIGLTDGEGMCRDWEPPGSRPRSTGCDLTIGGRVVSSATSSRRAWLRDARHPGT